MQGKDERTEEIVISFRKIADNMRRYWWILLISAGAGLLLIILSTLKAWHSSEKVAIPEDEKRYQAVTLVYMEPKDIETGDTYGNSGKSSDLGKIADTYEKSDKRSEEQWNWNKNNQLMYNCKALLKSDNIIGQLNTVLKQNKMRNFDTVLDKPELQVEENSQCYSITVRGKNAKRVELISNTMTELLTKEAADIFGISNSKIINRAVVNLYKKTNDANNPYEIITEKSLNGEIEEENKLSVSSFLSVKKILLLFIGIFIGIAVIFVLILKDKKLRSKEEIAAYFQLPCLGVFGKKKHNISISAITTALFCRCQKESIHNMLITAPGESVEAEKIAERIIREAEKAKKDEIKVSFIPDIRNNADAVKAADEADAVIFMLTADNDEIQDVDDSLDRIKVVQGRLLGYLLING